MKEREIKRHRSILPQKGGKVERLGEKEREKGREEERGRSGSKDDRSSKHAPKRGVSLILVVHGRGDVRYKHGDASFTTSSAMARGVRENGLGKWTGKGRACTHPYKLQ